LALCVAASNAFAANYYVSNAGNDANNGTSTATPWRTLAKLSAELGGTSGTWGTISTGDKVYFRRGDVFRGSIAFSAYNNDGITFDAYGSGALPIVKGSDVVTTWTVHSGNIWKATVSKRVYFLYVNTTLKTLARAPNTGTWNLSTATGTALTSASIGSSGLNFVGANVCVREYDWQLNRQVVTTQSSNTVNWATAMNAASAGANFYFDNKLSLLDTDGEWFYDNATQTLYLMSAMNPNTLTVEGSTNLLGIAGNDNRSNNTFQNLRFEHFAQEGIRIMGSGANNVIQNCEFNNNNQALFVSGAGNNIQNNAIQNSTYHGAVLANMGNGAFSNNTISNSGMNFGQHRPDFTGSFYAGGLWLININAGCTVANNVFNNMGGNGIRFGGTGITIERNQISNALLNMSDGGAIYTWGVDSHDCIVKNNLINGVFGDKNGVYPSGIALGIYIDNNAYNMQLLDNTIQNVPVGGGMVINAGAHGCTITGNVTYKCLQGMTFFDWLSGASVYSNTASGNTFYANLSGAIPIQIASDDNNHTVMTSSNNNFLCNPYGTKVAEYLWTNAQTFTLAQWRTTTGLDAASVGSYYTWTSPTDNSFLVVNNTTSAATYNYTNVKNLNNQAISSITLQPFTSQVLINVATLPIELLTFKGTPQYNGNFLTWETANEVNNKGFNVERLMDNGEWLILGFVKSTSARFVTSPTLITTYDFIDNQPFATSYYRLRQLDNDGKETLSKVISVSTNANNKLKIYPNPVSDVLTIESNVERSDFQIVNLLGQQVLTGKATQRLDVSALPKGAYFLRIGEEQVRFVKQ
jgi:parallel beta-helix repeat protein